MSHSNTTRQISFLLDGRKVSADEHEILVQVADRFGVSIPTLCHHEALSPAGACRLCLVEVKQGRRTKLVTACTFPVEDGIEVTTTSETITQHRRTVLELLLNQSSNAPAISAIAAEYGIDAPKNNSGENGCILCSLCTRVCETYATRAITTTGRGDKKDIGTYMKDPPTDCVACGACADICPTGHIQATRSPGAYRIWDKEIPIATCAVNTKNCIGCGTCEAACPFRIPRVALYRDGTKTASIKVDACRGCGVCLAACPSGAIEQPRAKRILPVADQKQLLVIACGRANLGQHTSKKLPGGAALLELPCTGGVTTAQLLGALAVGYSGVMVLGRHEETCRLQGAEDHSLFVCETANRLARLTGLGENRVVFVESPPGQDGPMWAINSFCEELNNTPLKDNFDAKKIVDSTDGAKEILAWLSTRTELVPDTSAWLLEHGLPAAQAGKPVLYIGSIPYLDILLGELIDTDLLSTPVGHALDVLAALGIEAGVAIGGIKAAPYKMAKQLSGSDFYTICPDFARHLNDANIKFTSFNEVLEKRGAELGLPSQPDSITEDNIVETTTELVKHLIANRNGSWRNTQTKPVLATTNVAALIAAGGRK